MTAEDFTTMFPEFATADTGLIEVTIAAQEGFVSDSWPNTQRLTVLGLRVADSLARSPFGRNARLQIEDKKTKRISTTYGDQLGQLVLGHGSGLARLA
jgi:hypothetical protein